MKHLLFYCRRPEDALWLRALTTLGADYTVESVSEPEPCRQMLEQKRYCLLVLPAHASFGDADALLHQVQPELAPGPPRVLILASTAEPLPILPGDRCLILQMPTTLRRLHERIRELAALPPLPSAELLRTKWLKFCEERQLTGIHPGIGYLGEALILYLRSPGSRLQSLYQTVAENNRITATQVERAIVYGLTLLWKPPLPGAKPSVREALPILCAIALEGKETDHGSHV